MLFIQMYKAYQAVVLNENTESETPLLSPGDRKPEEPNEAVSVTISTAGH